MQGNNIPSCYVKRIGQQLAHGMTHQDFRSSELHAHCHQKALFGTSATLALLCSVPGYEVTETPSGCCGMAGSFGYEKEHYDLRLQIGELSLFPAIRAASPDTLIAAPGTSCRHQIVNATGREAKHPIEMVAEALGNSEQEKNRNV